MPGLSAVLVAPWSRRRKFILNCFASRFVCRAKSRDQALAALAAEYARRLEYFCRRAPFQWYNFYDFWQLSSDGKP